MSSWVCEYITWLHLHSGGSVYKFIFRALVLNSELSIVIIILWGGRLLLSVKKVNNWPCVNFMPKTGMKNSQSREVVETGNKN